MNILVASGNLPQHERVVAELSRAERAEGWAARCHDAGLYLVPTEELVTAMAALLARIGEDPVVEVCAGDGALSGALRSRGAAVTATDARPSSRRPWEVRALTAREALEKYRPRVVIGSFVPVDADVDPRVLADPCVRHYIVLNARIGLAATPAIPEAPPSWSRTELPQLRKWMVTRHDGWIGDHLPIRHYGEAWLLSRGKAGDRDASPIPGERV